MLALSPAAAAPHELAPAAAAAPGSCGGMSQDLAQQPAAACPADQEARAAAMCELAAAASEQGRAEEATALYRKAYELRLHTVAAALRDSQLTDAAEQPAAPRSADLAGAASQQQPRQQPPQPPQPAPAGSSGSSGGGSDAGGWDASDDWEPDVSSLRAAASYEQRAPGAAPRPPAGVLQPFASSPHPYSSSPGRRRSSSVEHNRSALSEPSCSARPSSSGGGARPRGRGRSRCGWDSSGSDDEVLLLAAQSLPHIVEVHGLTRAVKTSHLEEFLLDFMWGPVAATLKWVDDEHALAVFPCAEAAQALLESPQRQFKVRPYAKASKAALQIPAEDLLPPRGARPKTTTAVARRLISNALGNREVRDRAAERELADLRRANKQGRQQRQQQLEAAWGDDD